MAFDGLDETLETLKEIISATSSISTDSADKKAISDVMLALEKILPIVSPVVPPQTARLCQALGTLYEKLLMESVSDIDSGVELTKTGVEIIRLAALGEKEPKDLENEAEAVVAKLVEIYEIEVPGALLVAPAPVEKKTPPKAFVPPKILAPTAIKPEPVATEAKNDEDDAFFQELSSIPEQTPVEDDGGTKEGADTQSDPLTARISEIASDFTMLDADHTDKKLVADIMLGFESALASFKETETPGPITSLAGALAGLYEKSIMEGIADGEAAMDITSNGLKTLMAYLEKIETTGSVMERAKSIVQSLEKTFGVTYSSGEEGPAPLVEAPAPKDVAETDSEPAETPAPSEPAQLSEIGPPTDAGDDVVKIATEDDLLLYTEFVAETADTIHSIETELLELENDPTDDELINNLFRAYHSLKGAAGFLGASTINVLCHEAETLLDKIRKKVFVCNQAMIDAFLNAADVIKLVNDGMHGNCEITKQSLPDAELRIPRFNIEKLLENLSLLSSQKYVAQDDDEPDKLGEIMVKRKLITEEQLEQALENQKPLGKILVDMGVADEHGVSEALQVQSAKKKKIQVTSLKVDTEKLDHLLELVGELVISQSIVAQDDVLNEEKNQILLKNLMNLGKITKNIQDRVMGLRMVPLKQTFQKMSRLVRDLSKKMGKTVQYKCSGEETEIDKSIIEELNDPLVHLLRNSMDHGMESTEDRIAAGKDPTGTVSLVAYHRGGNVHIEVIDDGKGLDREKIRNKAIDKGLISKEDELHDVDIYNLVFQAGFSTHEVATDLSGRGVGMDVVRSNMEKLGGKVEMTSKLGKGTTITMKLPLTMAIVDGMIVRIGQERFIIPTISIRESIRPVKEDMSHVQHDGEMINVRGHLMPLVRLHGILKVENAEHHNPWEGLVIIVETDESDFGFMVDDLLGQQQVVIKSLGKRFKGLPGISGGTILGDGRVGLILDIGGIVAMR
ncbi:Signal transduction histidine kinase CheA [hydrothermal vent metagenome]|uniref:Chemotaxis protein CheA n=1 Tax=hydrothermal vent metagenome TaxID=652676 RepID=A0A3B1CB33_9ZZZZ